MYNEFVFYLNKYILKLKKEFVCILTKTRELHNGKNLLLLIFLLCFSKDLEMFSVGIVLSSKSVLTVSIVISGEASI